jgi:hypothetical protein
MGTTKNYVIAIVLLVVVIGGVTWLVQYMPSWRRPREPVQPSPGPEVREILKFSRPSGPYGLIHAVFEREVAPDPKVLPPHTATVVGMLGSPLGLGTWCACATLPGLPLREAPYALETEPGKGHYYFPFINKLSGVPAEFELYRAACDCSSAEICLLADGQWREIDAILAQTPWADPMLDPAPQWHKLTKNEHTGFKIPPGGCGILRINWTARKMFGEYLNINLEFWMQPEGDLNGRLRLPLMVPVVMSRPILFEPDRQQVGVLGPGQKARAEFYCWSPTRDQLNVSFQPAGADPLFQIESRPLSVIECQELQEKLSKNGKEPRRYRVRTGYHVTATLREGLGKLQMPQGPFQRHLPIRLDESALDYPTAVVVGIVKGDVDVGGEADQGRIQLRTFSASEPKTAVIPLYANSDVNLELSEHFPPFFKVELQKNARESTPQRAQWDLKLTVPAGEWTGELPTDSRVMVRIAGNPPRLINIPVVGLATR